MADFNTPDGDIESLYLSDLQFIDNKISGQLWGWGWNFDRIIPDDGIPSNIVSTPVVTNTGNKWVKLAKPIGRNHLSAYRSCYGIKSDGTLWGWGRAFGMGVNITSIGVWISTPVTTFAGGTNWKQVSVSNIMCMAIKTDGTLWTWGYAGGTAGIHGINSASTSITIYTPVTTFAGGTDWKQVSLTWDHCAAVKHDGTLWMWGTNNYGQLGTGNFSNTYTPITTFAGGTNWSKVSCGKYYTLAIKSDGTLWGWGLNSSAQLGNNTTNNALTPITTFSGGTDWVEVDSNGGDDAATIALKNDGTLWTWGWNQLLGANKTVAGSISTPITTFAGGNNWKSISSNMSVCAAVKTDGTLWMWGTNSVHQISSSGGTRYTPAVNVSGWNWKQSAIAEDAVLAITSGFPENFQQNNINQTYFN